MSLYHKYRPKTFDEVIGNKDTLDSIKADLGKEDKPHAILIFGPVGCGKTTIARIIAKTLGCLDRDFVEINSADFRGIDTIRDIIQTSKFKAITGIITLS